MLRIQQQVCIVSSTLLCFAFSSLSVTILFKNDILTLLSIINYFFEGKFVMLTLYVCSVTFFQKNDYHSACACVCSLFFI